MRKFGYFFFGALLGGIVGSLTTLLLAPSSGETTRKYISDYILKTTDEVKQAAQSKREELEGQLVKLRQPEITI